MSSASLHRSLLRKRAQKETPFKEFRPLRRATNAPWCPDPCRLLKKGKRARKHVRAKTFTDRFVRQPHIHYSILSAKIVCHFPKVWIFIPMGQSFPASHTETPAQRSHIWQAQAYYTATAPMNRRRQMRGWRQSFLRCR